MFKIIKYLLILSAIIFIIGFLSYKSGINSSVSKIDDDMIFTVSQGEGAEQIAENLLDAGLIGSKFYFNIYVWRANLQSGLQAGEYALNPAMSIKNIVDKLAVGRSLSQEMKIKILEGWNIKNIDEYLSERGIAAKGEFIKLANSPLLNLRKIRVWEFLEDAPKTAGLEGFLFPDTYRIYKDATTGDVIVKMLDNFEQKLTSRTREDITKQRKTIYEIVIMASLIEKEVRGEQDMKIVSGVFWDRIKNGQPLESCATLAYILGVNKPRYTLEDTKINSLYNTYQNRGLPPGPICNPGLAAITAAIYPEYTEYNYFLNRQDTGETIFSKTYEEHLRNKGKYLK